MPKTLVALVVLASMTAVLGYRLMPSWPMTAAPSTASPSSTAPSSSAAAPATDTPRSERRVAHGDPNGVLPKGTTVFDDVVGIAKLDPALLDALRRAATDAASDGIAFFVTSGWRSHQYQEALFREAVAEYGSATEAARWVAAPDTSTHVSGDAVDIGPADATAWLSAHGATYGLCQIYRNEPWHFELRPEAIHRGCPPIYADPYARSKGVAVTGAPGGAPASQLPMTDPRTVLAAWFAAATLALFLAVIAMDGPLRAGLAPWPGIAVAVQATAAFVLSGKHAPFLVAALLVASGLVGLVYGLA